MSQQRSRDVSSHSKAAFALLTVLGLSLATGVLAPTANAHTYLLTSSHADGG